MKEWFFHSQFVSVATCPAQNPPEHVSTLLIGRECTVCDGKGETADVIRDHPVRNSLGTLPGSHSRDVSDTLDQGRQQIGLINIILVLKDHGNSLETHSRIDTRLGQNDAIIRSTLLKLHEDQIPDLHPAIAITHSQGTFRSAGAFFPTIHMQLGTGSTGPRIAHRPEVVLDPEADDAISGNTDMISPDLPGFIVFLEDGDPHAVGIDAETLGDQLPCPGTRFLFEVIAEGKVAKHFKEGQVAGGVTHILKVVVLAPGTDALLGRTRSGNLAGLLAGEDTLELVHPGVGEEQCRIFVGHDGTRGHLFVSVGLEVIEELITDLFYTHLGCTSLNPGNRYSCRYPSRFTSSSTGGRILQGNPDRHPQMICGISTGSSSSMFL